MPTKKERFSNLSKSPCLVNFDNLYTAQLLSCLEVIPLPLSTTATAGFPCVSSKSNLICILLTPALREVADNELSINSARANAGRE